MDRKSRKDLAREYADRKQSIGVYAVRCAATGEVWVGSTRNLDKKKNALWFTLKMGGATEKDLQAAFAAHGEAAFSYEILEELTEDNPHTLKALLPEREKAWRADLNASCVGGV